MTKYSVVEAFMVGNDVKIGIPPHVHKLCGTGEYDTCTHRGIDPHTATMSYMPISECPVSFPSNGYWYLDQDMGSESSQVMQGISGDLYLCLNGHKLTNYVFTSNLLGDINKKVYITDCKGGSEIIRRADIDYALYNDLSGGIISNKSIEVKTDFILHNDALGYETEGYDIEFYNVRFRQAKSGEITTNNYGFMKSNRPGHITISSISVSGYSMNTASYEYKSLIYLDNGDAEIIDSNFSNNNFDLFVRTHSANITLLIQL